MRPRFSLRLFLIAFTLLAILFGAAAHYVYRIKDQVRRHEAACTKLDELGYYLREEPDWPDESVPSWIAEFARNWIDSKAFPPAMRVELVNDVLTEPEARERMGLVRDVGAVGKLEVFVWDITPAIVDLLKPFTQLRAKLREGF